MSREVRRVPLDFDFPIGETWGGYLLPDELALPPCPDCDWLGRGPTGWSREAFAVYTTFHPVQIDHAVWTRHLHPAHVEALAWHDKIGQAEVDHLIASGRLRVWDSNAPSASGRGAWVSPPRTAEEVNATERATPGGVHDTSNHYALTVFRCERLGIPINCPTCDGDSTAPTPEQRAAYEAWQETPPPTGDGWQLWQTVSEGGPVTPVFATAEALIDHLVTVDGYRRAAAEQLVTDGSSIGSFVVVGGQFLDSSRDADKVAAIRGGS